MNFTFCRLFSKRKPPAPAEGRQVFRTVAARCGGRQRTSDIASATTKNET